MCSRVFCLQNIGDTTKMVTSQISHRNVFFGASARVCMHSPRCQHNQFEIFAAQVVCVTFISEEVDSEMHPTGCVTLHVKKTRSGPKFPSNVLRDGERVHTCADQCICGNNWTFFCKATILVGCPTVVLEEISSKLFLGGMSS